MSCLLVPQDVGSTRATVWIGFFGEPEQGGGLALAGGPTVPVSAGAFVDPWPRGGLRLRYQRVEITGLVPGTEYALRFSNAGAVLSEGRLRTLPRGLPGPAEKPLRVLLGSCFAYRNDHGVAQAYAKLSGHMQERPDLKVLCGDQVYLDMPWNDFFFGKSEDELEQAHLETYQKSWQGLAALLSDGSGFFTSDDHEFWNNYPSFSVMSAATWSSSGKEKWERVARTLFDAVQSTRPVQSFDVGRLSFFVADTRIHRDGDRKLLMRDADFAALQAWLARLQGPGVLVVGQPIFDTKAGFVGRLKRKFADWELPDYEQYEALCKSVLAAPHSVVVLTGDVHWGRIGRSSLDTGGMDLIEIIASPLALIDKVAQGKIATDPQRFPPFAIGGLTQRPIAYEGGYVRSRDGKGIDDHFVTVDFTDLGARVRVVVSAWRIYSSEPGPAFVWERTIA